MAFFSSLVKELLRAYNELLHRGGGAVEKNQDMFQLLLKEKDKQELSSVISCNEKTGQFGLTLTEGEAKELMLCRNESLKKYQRVEFGGGILEKLIEIFCDSQYISQSNYTNTLEQLQDIFYEFKNEAQDLLTDDELLTFMKEQFEGVCFGDLEYLEGTCLDKFAEAIRGGYRGYQSTGGEGEYSQFDDVQRWDKNVYMEIVKELFW